MDTQEGQPEASGQAVHRLIQKHFGRLTGRPPWRAASGPGLAHTSTIALVSAGLLGKPRPSLPPLNNCD